ncbi:carboxypeptidase regulatory-like domain-containing protein [Tenacibaculum agarivorans]|uniref:carboxypeptidase regulatory-like domain-containing protein n=1 Tax=Tenacibaculum agarivorans TaxID=1908389 RepID=UPI00094B9957|nr:carboxypeptidase regulatory-like domain-containing protein [Tenacibaculum agarivorans]
MKKYTFLLCAILCYLASASQTLSEPLWATYFGSSSADRTMDVKAACNGDVFITGSTNGTSFTMSTTIPPKIYGSLGNTNTYVARLKSDGSTVIWWAIIGTTAFDMACRLAVDLEDNVYLAGPSYADFGISSPAPVAAHQGGEDAFCAKFNGEDGDLLWHTFIGGTGNDSGEGIEVDLTTNQVIIGGSTTSASLPLQHPDTGHAGDQDIFCAKLTADEGTLKWTSQLGGIYRDMGWGAAIDSNGDAYVTGMKVGGVTATAPNNGYGMLNGGGDMICAKFEENTGKILWYSVIGDAGTEIAWEVEVNSRDEVLIAGQASGSSVYPFPWNVTAASQALLVSFNGTDGTLLYERRYGGSNAENAYHLALDGKDNIYISGQTRSNDLLTVEVAANNTPYNDTFTGSDDVFLAMFEDNNGSVPSLHWHTYYSTTDPSSSRDVTNGMTIAPDGSIYIAGDTSSTNFEVLNSTIQTTKLAGTDGFVVKFKPIYNFYTISGRILTDTGVPVPGVTLNLEGTNTANSRQTVTLASGEYKFQLLSQDDYILTPSRNDGEYDQSIVTFNDLFAIGNHVFGGNRLTEYRMIAADMDNDNDVDRQDYFAFTINYNLTNLIHTWRFVTADYMFQDRDNPFIDTPPFPETISFLTLNQNFINQDFIGMRIGDVMD